MLVTIADEFASTGGFASIVAYHGLEAEAKVTFAGNDAVLVKLANEPVTAGAVVGLTVGFAVGVGVATGAAGGAATGVGLGVGVAAPVTVTLVATMPPVGHPVVITVPLEFFAVPITVTEVPEASVPFAMFVANGCDVAGVTEISPQPFAASK
jgi:hypothetical protein